MRHPFLVGNKIYLRTLDDADLDGPWCDWLNDYDVTRYLVTGSFPSRPESLRSYYETVVRSPDNVMLAIIESSGDKHIGNIKLGPINRLNQNADLAIMIGDKDSWGKGYGREAWELMVEYGFQRLNLHKITLGVYADHKSGVSLYQKVGFKIEGNLRQQLFRDGAYHDKYVMGLLRDEYEAEITTPGKNEA